MLCQTSLSIVWNQQEVLNLEQVKVCLKEKLENQNTARVEVWLGVPGGEWQRAQHLFPVPPAPCVKASARMGIMRIQSICKRKDLVKQK